MFGQKLQVSHTLTCPPMQQQSVRISSSIAAERGIFSEIQSDFKDGGRSAGELQMRDERRAGEMEGGWRRRQAGGEAERDGVS